MVLVCSVPPTINSGFTLVKISEASSKSALSLMNIGPTSSFAHSPSNRPGLVVAARYSSVSSLFHCCRQTAYTAALRRFCPRSTGPYLATLLSLVSKALNLGACTTESAPSNIFLIKGNSGISSSSFL